MLRHTGGVDVVEFRLEREELGAGTFPVINLVVNGARLQEIVRRVELPFAKAEGKPDLAGRYAGLAVRGPGLPARHFLGKPVETWFGDGDTILLGCVCGDPGCWPLTARVEVSDSTVVWSGFRTGHRAWDISSIGAFTFDRHTYDAALAAACPA